MKTMSDTLRDRLGSFSVIDKAAKNVESAIRRSLRRRSKKIPKLAGRSPRHFTVKQIYSISKKILNGRYRLSPLMPVEIPKPGKKGKTRGLLVPTQRDRIVHKAMLRVLRGHFVKGTSGKSYGVRSGQGVHSALTGVRRELDAGKKFILVCDIKSFFTAVDRDLLREEIDAILPDSTLDFLIGDILKIQFVQPPKDPSNFPGDVGIPQGNALSPIFSDIFLRDFDDAMADAGYRVFRYIDDFAIVGSSRRELYNAFRKARSILKKKGLEVHDYGSEKCSVAHVSEGQVFLGVSIGEGPVFMPDSKKVHLFKMGLASRIRRVIAAPHDHEQIDAINSAIIGWSNAYAVCDQLPLQKVFNSLNDVIRRALRKEAEKQGMSDEQLYCVAEKLLVFRVRRSRARRTK